MNYTSACLKRGHASINSITKDLDATTLEKSYSVWEHQYSARHYPGYCAHIPQGMDARSSPVPLPMGILAHAPPAQVSPRGLPRMARCAPFLLPGSKMNHSFGDISPANQFDELKQALLDQNTSQGCQVYFPLIFMDWKLLQDFWREQLRAPLLSSTLGSNEARPWGQPWCSWNVRGSTAEPPVLRCGLGNGYWFQTLFQSTTESVCLCSLSSTQACLSQQALHPQPRAWCLWKPSQALWGLFPHSLRFDQ